MKPTIHSQNTELFKSLISKRIISVRRQVFDSDMDLDNYERMADGPTEFKFDNDKIVCFFAITETNSVGITDDVMQRYGSSYITLNLSSNLFWQQRINQEVEAISILQSRYASTDNPSEFGVEFKLKNGTCLCIEYLDEENFPDTIRVLEEYKGPQCIRRIIY